MKSKTLNFIAFTFLFSMISSLALGQKGDRKKEQNERLQALWVAFATQALELTPQESETFWPIYNEYRAKERKLKQHKKQLHKGPLSEKTDQEIEQALEKGFKIEEEMIALRREYTGKLKTAIPIRKVVRIPKVERDFKKKILELMKRKRAENGGGGHRGQGN